MKNLSNTLIRPHVTEKATMSAERSVYVFEVDPQATKSDIHKAFVEKYKITPVRINTVTIPAKNKKAYIYLKKGEKLEN